MEKQSISYSQTGYFQRLFLDYVSGNNTLKEFYTYDPSYKGIEKILQDYSFSEKKRATLIEHFKEQYLKFEENNSYRLKLIEALKSNNTYTVCTGHQVCLLTGSLYFIYKIVNAINLAKRLNDKHPGKKFIPVYWMATEDHDFEEVNHINIYGKKVEWKTGQKGAVGNFKLKDISEVINEIVSQVKGLPFGANVAAMLHECYNENHTLATATFKFVNMLFEGTDLLILDADSSLLKNEFKEELKGDILESKNFDAVNDSSEKLRSIGYDPQINAREINVFFKKDELRERIIKEGEKFTVLNSDISFTKSDIESAIELNPENFSPNVVLRPLYQQAILPNVVYIGGGAEVCYWLQLKKMFDDNKIPFPVLIGRNSVLIYDDQSKDKLNKLDLKIEDLFKETNVLIKEYIEERLSGDLDFIDEEAQLNTLYNKIESVVEKVDVTLKPTTKAELHKVLKGLKNLRAKVIKAEKRKQEVTLNQVVKIKEKLFPNGSLQERHENIVPLIAQYGVQFIPELLNSVEPFDEFSLLKKN